MPSAAEWSKRVSQWKRSGKSLREFAAARGWKVGTLAWWSSELNRRAAAAPQVRLVRLECPEAAADEACTLEAALAVADDRQPRVDGLELEVPRGCVVRVRRGFDGELLRQLVVALEAR